MNFGAFESVAKAIQALAQGSMPSPVQDYKQFLAKVNSTGSAVSSASSTNGFKYGEGTSANAYARQNVLQVMQGRGDPVLAFDWIAVILDPTVNSSKQLPWQYIDKLATPALSIDVQQLFRNGKNLKFASAFSAESISLTLYTDVAGVGINYANNWVRSVYRSDSFYNLSKNYKRDIQIYMLDAKRSVVVDIRFVGCFPTAWDSYALSSDGSILETNLTLSVDDIKVSYETDTSAAKTSLSSTFGLNEQAEKAKQSLKRKASTFITF